nr:MAG TPA: hypothetical protein [Caudoviricetes sp.]
MHHVGALAGRRFARPRIPILFSLYQETRALRYLQTLPNPPDGFSLAVGRATGSQHAQHAPTVKGAFGIQGRHRSDSNASHSAPSTRQGGAHNLQQAKEKQ